MRRRRRGGHGANGGQTEPAGRGSYWWLRSPGSDGFGYVVSDGGPHNAGATGALGVVPLSPCNSATKPLRVILGGSLV